ncbi:MAG TPA: molybdopterin cofactor-binding domain-containing protein [Candidatus Binatia bacterium]|jgi:CO/xanthine dehydrogenase Mo-binding subunit
MKTPELSRRRFLQGTGALIVSFSLFPRGANLFAQSAAGSGDNDPQSLDSWLAVAPDGTVTFYTSKVEIGTGTITALAQIVAEELDVPLDRVKMASGDTANTIEQGSTVGSRTIERAGPQIRQASAAARRELLKLAAARLKAPIEKLAVSDGVVSVMGDSAKKVAYGELIGGKRFDVKISATGTGWDMKVAPDAKAKDPKDYKIVGKPLKRFDVPKKLVGEEAYIHDLRIPGMLHGRVVRPPVVNSEPAKIDETAARDIPGFVKVVREGSFVGVVAKTEWGAIKAADALKVEWTPPKTKLPVGDELYKYLKTSKSVRTQKVVEKGDVAKALGEAKKTYQASFRWPFQMHGMIGPSCAIADVKGDKATIWSGPQGPFRTRTMVANLLKIPEQNVRVVYHEASGSYGRMSTDDGAEDAALLSRAVGAPVRVQWSRRDEHGWEPKGPAQLEEVKAAVDADGKIVAWNFVDYDQPWTASGSTLLLASLQIGLKPNNPGGNNGFQSGGELYEVPNQKIVIEYVNWHFPEPIPLRTSNLRAPGSTARCFASECLLDDIAADVKVDPVEYRLRHISERRGIDCLKAAAEKAGWQKRPSPAPSQSGGVAKGRGVALTRHSDVWVAVIADVEVNKTTGQVAVKRLICAHDCGLMINPDGVANQVEGNVIQGVSRALLEEVTFDASGVTSLDWQSYPILRFPDVPAVDVVLINRPEMQALGAGEPSTVPVTAAVGNAIFDATGARLREAPFTPSRVLAVLKERAAQKS